MISIKNFIVFTYYIFIYFIRSLKYIVFLFISFAPINIILTFIYEEEKIKFAIVNAVIGVSSFIGAFMIISLLFSAVYVLSDPALRAAMRLSTFTPAKSAKRYLGSDGKSTQ